MNVFILVVGGTKAAALNGELTQVRVLSCRTKQTSNKSEIRFGLLLGAKQQTGSSFIPERILYFQSNLEETVTVETGK